MKRLYTFCLLPLLLSAALPFFVTLNHEEDETSTNTDTAYKWSLLTKEAAFPKSYNFQLFSLQDTLWAFHPKGTWYSQQGNTWTKNGLSNSIHNLAFLDYIPFKGQVLGLGYLEGNIESFTFQPKISSTTDRQQWTTLSENSTLPRRFFAHPFVFNGKIWLIGGMDGHKSFDEIWNSADGVQWTKQAEKLPFGKRESSQVIQLENKLYLLNNDVWSSVDGLSWTKITDAIVPGEEIFGYTAVVFDHKIWLLGCNRNGRFKSEILVSTDGKKWRAERAPWSPRGGIAACVHQNKLYVTGGKYGGQDSNGETEFIYSNDVWCLEKTDKKY